MPARDFREQDLDQTVAGCYLVVPNDDNDLARFAISLRIYNPNDAASTIKLDTVNGDTVTITVPPGSLVAEPIFTAKVYSTGTSDGVVIHGYY